MAYYTSVMSMGGSKRLFAAGPFKTHGAALAQVEPVRKLLHEKYPNDAPWVGVGTAHDKVRHDRVGKFNTDLGVRSYCVCNEPLYDDSAFCAPCGERASFMV